MERYLANPPLKVSDWSGALLRGDRRFAFGDPPVGNANYAWIQHFIHRLAYPNGGGGMAGFVIANGSLSSNIGGEGEIRRKIVEADLVDCIVTLPGDLFFTTPIAVCLWFITRDKSGNNLLRGGRQGGRHGETLFIDGRSLGKKLQGGQTILCGLEDAESVSGDTTGDPLPHTNIGRIVYTYRQWRGEPAPKWWDTTTHGEWSYKNIPAFCNAARIADIAKHAHVLTPRRYMAAVTAKDDSEDFSVKYPQMIADIEEQFARNAELADVVSKQLRRLYGAGNANG